MKVIISPAKTMRQDPKAMQVNEVPPYPKQTRKLLKALQKLSFSELKELYNASDAIAELNHQRFAKMKLEEDLTAAIFAYQGQVFQHINVAEMMESELEYLQKHLRILSGFYGIVRPFDGIVPYRLEMGNKLSVGKAENLYDFWRDVLYQDLFGENDVVINLASKEYFQVISKHLKKEDQFITVEFSKKVNGKLRQLGMMSKSARGEMVRFMAEKNVEDPKELQEFRYEELKFAPEFSDDRKFVFL